MDETRSPARDTLRDIWTSRPVRPRDDRKLAGVAAAVARRYEVDPTLIRIGFVVSALVGPGLPLYLASCAVLPDAGPPGAGPAPSRPGSALSVVLLALAAVLTIPLVFQPDRLIATVATAALLLALHLTRGARPGGRAAAIAATPVPAWSGGPAGPVGVPAGGETAAAPGAGAAAPAVPVPLEPVRTPPDWDPLGAAPFAWDLPEPGPEPAPPPARRSALTPVTLAVALIVAGMVGVLALAAPGAVPASAVPGAALAVVGIGLVLGAFRRAGRWLIPAAVLLAVVTALTGLLNGALGPDGWAVRGGIGPIADTPASVQALAPEYRRGTGTIDLDLTRLDLAADPAAGPVRTRAEVGAGGVTVVVPQDADLRMQGSVGYGDVTLDGRSESGQDARIEVTDPGPDGPGGRVLELDLRARTGFVEVRRG
ncbi:PspC domain-containing protein [Pseudonocardia nantongensis]|uniref:PspC domain-containing protein n=1 Tax=Pseudonocardia nantongensis TaxID=1181885 RepID=UPI00397E175D